MKEIQLTQGMITIVDDEDYKWLSKWKWCAHKERYTFYATRCVRINGKNNLIKMHREILGLIHKDGKIGDHKDRNGLNNQRDNLRVVHPTLNGYNSKIRKNNTSGYRGVYWNKRDKVWRAYMRINGIVKYCGSYQDKISAAKGYDKFAILSRGGNAILNFPV